MRFSKTELRLLEQVALGNRDVMSVVVALHKDKSQIYRIIKRLKHEGVLNLHNKKLMPLKATHIQLLLQELSKQSSFIEDISGSGLKFYACILQEAKSIDEIRKATGLQSSTIFNKIKTARRKSLIKTTQGKYQFNSVLWKGLYDFFVELKKYEAIHDARIPPGSEIYYKTEKEIVFSTKAELSASLTGFSAFENYGIKLYTIDNTYYLPKKKLSKKDVFLHALYRCEKEGTIQNLILLTLFYVKYKQELSKISCEIVRNINKLLQGNTLVGYPTLAEIKSRAEVYEIEV